MNLLPYNPPAMHGAPVPLTTLDAEALEVSRDMGLEFHEAKLKVLTMRYSVVELL